MFFAINLKNVISNSYQIIMWKSYLVLKKLSIDLLSIDRCGRVHGAPVIAGAVAENKLPPTPETAAGNKH